MKIENMESRITSRDIVHKRRTNGKDLHERLRLTFAKSTEVDEHGVKSEIGGLLLLLKKNIHDVSIICYFA